MFRTESEFKVVEEPKETSLDTAEAELASLQAQFLDALKGNMGRGFSNVLQIRQDGQDRLFYVVSRGLKVVQPLKTTETLLCMRDDFQVYHIVRTVTISTNGQGGTIDHQFAKVVDPAKAGLSGLEAGKIVKRVIERRD